MCDDPIIVENVKEFKKIPVPCGKCPPCVRRRIDSWVFRLMEEDRISSSSHFVTLTYSNHTIPLSKNGFPTLFKKDLQDFWKRLRKNTGYENIRYYACGEYGEKNNRPHYHAIVFNCPTAASYQDSWALEKSAFLKKYNPRLDPWPHLKETDKCVLGSVHVGQVSGQSIAYTAGYMEKKRRIPKHSREDFAPEFSVMSKGLGRTYCEKLEDGEWIPKPEIIDYHRRRLDQLYLTRRGGYRLAMPKYYRDKIFTDYDKERQLYLIHDACKEKIRQEKEDCAKANVVYEDKKRREIRARKRKYDKYNSKNRTL